MKLTKPTSILICGPLIRHVDRSSAVVWAEVREPLDVEVLLQVDSSPTMPAAGLPVSQRAWTIRVEDSYYAWVAIGFLLPDTWYSYRIVGHRKNGTSIPLWPDSRLSGVALPSVFKTLPLWSLDTFRVAYGSCRKGYAVLDDKAPATGPDALEGLAHLLQQNFDRRDQAWPHVLQLMGDQIYADDFSGALARKFGHKLAADFTEFAQIYREAWTARPGVRWALSCIPSFMIFDDHEINDDWNITRDWVRAHRTPTALRQLTDGLMAYWVYQGAGNLQPRKWAADERMRLLNPRIEPLIGDVTDRLRRLCQNYVTGRRQASWGYAIDAGGTRIAVADTRMHRKLTGHRLMMNDPTWDEFTHLAKSHVQRRVILITPGPLLLPQPLHDLQSWIADKIENDPSLFERILTGAAGGLAGAIVGGIIGFAVGGPGGALVGAGIGAGVGATAGFFLEEIIEKIIGGKIADLDIELWPVFPTSFNRMVRLLEDLADGRGTVRKTFISILGGDVHFSYAMRGELLRSQSRRSVWHLTLSPTGNLLDESRDDVKTLKALMGGDFSARTELNLLKMSGIYYRPDFVDQQLRHLQWYPLAPDGSRADPARPDEWAHFGNFLGWLELQGTSANYRYDRAEATEEGVVLKRLAGTAMMTV